MEERALRRMEFWGHISWQSLHEPVRTIEDVPDAAKGPLAELRRIIAENISEKAGTPDEEVYLKAFFFLDRLMFAAVRRRRGGARGQRGEGYRHPAPD